MNWTRRTRQVLGERLPAEELLPDRLPAYVRSAVYLLGVLTLSSLVVIFFSGIVLVIGGVQWWHTSPLGHFFNSLHFWGVQLFFFCMVLHLWAQYFMGAWRDGRAWTWVSGVLAFLVSVPAAFTGYLSQTNFDAQWIGLSAKDAFNAVGLGGLFNVLDLGQMLGLHILFFPLIIVLLVAGHVLQVRMRGVVHPYPPNFSESQRAERKEDER
ncbi:cytochrome b N-terminal domain-containing protein [Rubrobacter naiadicus]|uniref:cytochrome b N-terminal domain-containing protein n=1 Tax=Rubrobacter naiadicus TaxID=1392641 RepID=UPI00236008FF|nr:cytochrome b N-terminal domain-containing protein [Rubrobacter naiadicus]